MKQQFLTPPMWLAAACFLLSLFVHLASIAGVVVLGNLGFFALHVGIFVVWMPAFLATREAKLPSDQTSSWNGSRARVWKEIFTTAPAWMRYGVQLVAAYALCNFLFFVIHALKHPNPADSLTPSVVRGFSGHWLIFYSAGFTVLYGALRRRALDDGK
ncbi:MAG TPA: hypothetical protein VGI10_06655 [Polyangiaceae bacterium]|jgi:hypothetical protein